jgi:HK97 family phage major capsid protein
MHDEDFKLGKDFSTRNASGGGEDSADAEREKNVAGIRQAILQELDGAPAPTNARARHYRNKARNMTMTVDEIISLAEDENLKHRRDILRIRDEAEENGRKLTRDEKSKVYDLEDAIERGKSRLEKLQAIKAEDDRQDEQMTRTVETHAGKQYRESQHGNTSDRRLDGTALYGAGGSYAPMWVDPKTGRDAALGRNQAYQDHPVIREEQARKAEQDRLIMGTHGSFAQQVRAVSTSGASAIVPTIWENEIIAKVRNKAVTLQAGVTVVPMPSKVFQVGRLVTDPTANFKTENSTITASDPAWDFIQLQATTLTALTTVSNEYLQDAINADSIVQDAIAAVMALEIDKTVLYGGFLTADGVAGEGYNLASPYPTNGVFKNLLTNAPGNVLGGGANGTVQTATSMFRELQTLYFSIKKRNENPGAMVMNDGMLMRYVDAYDTTGRVLDFPANIREGTILTTNAIPNVTRGTMTNASNVFCTDWSQVLLGQRQGLEIRVLRERYAEQNSTGIVATWRGDVALARLSAAGVYRYLQGS